VDAASFQFHHEQQVKRDQAACGPDFNGCEVDRAQDIPVGFEKRFPGCLSFSLGRWVDAMSFENVSDCLV
jgi:hypothetical protein